MSGKQELGDPSAPFSSPPRCTRGSGKCCELGAAVALGTTEGTACAARLQLVALVLSAEKQCSGMGWVQQRGPAAAPRDRQCSGVLWLLTRAMHLHVPAPHCALLNSPSIVRWLFFFPLRAFCFFLPLPCKVILLCRSSLGTFSPLPSTQGEVTPDLLFTLPAANWFCW